MDNEELLVENNNSKSKVDIYCSNEKNKEISIK